LYSSFVFALFVLSARVLGGISRKDYGALVVEKRRGDDLVHLWDASVGAKEDFLVCMLVC
jgi:hypothetical protein